MTRPDRLWCEFAWLAGEHAPTAGVLVELAGERIAALTPGVAAGDPAAAAAHRLAGLTVPGLVNAHSHAFHRALRGRTHTAADSFWSWREAMYRLAGAIGPATLFELARAVYAEMALAGITCVGEFHYLHHAPGGEPYPDPAAPAEAVAAAAAEAGLRLTLLDTCYLSAGWGAPTEGAQRRFDDRDVAGWTRRSAAVAASLSGGQVRTGAAVHSVRAVTPDQAREVARVSRERGTVLHVHLSEQPAENAGCREHYGASPTQVLGAAGLWGPATTAVHATHLEDRDIAALGAAGSYACLCPTTERELADGVGPAAALAAAGAPLCLGSDSQAVVDLLEEARAVELDERLVTGRRGTHTPAGLLAAATAHGARSLGWPEAGELRPGALADLTTLGLGSVRVAGSDRTPAGLAAAAVFAASAADVTDVLVGGEPVVCAGRHRLGDVGALLDAAVTAAWAGTG